LAGLVVPAGAAAGAGGGGRSGGGGSGGGGGRTRTGEEEEDKTAMESLRELGTEGAGMLGSAYDFVMPDALRTGRGAAIFNNVANVGSGVFNGVKGWLSKMWNDPTYAGGHGRNILGIGGGLFAAFAV